MKAIVAMAQNRVIGAEGSIPWHLPEDLKFFKATTLGHAIVMGRKTYASLGRPLPGRQNIVLSRTMPATSDLIIVRSPEELLEREDHEEFFVIGGAEIYKLLLPACHELLVTYVPHEIIGDTFFPRFEAEFDAGETVLKTADFTTRLHRRRLHH
jgi:dihydrofolate reductase